MPAGTWLAGAIVGKLIMDKTGWTSAAKSISDDLTKMSGLSKATADSFKKAGAMMIGIGGAIAGAIYGVAKAADESARVQGQMNAVLKSTGGVAGLTAGELNNLAAGLQKVTTFDDEAILGGQNLLLTFTGIGKDVFPAATAAMLDMSTALGQDLKGSAVQLGKALQDPVLGVTALRKAGVSFSADQRDMIKRLVETGDKLGAQKIILGELSREFGGSAKAAAETFGGQLAQLRNALGDVREDIGAAFLPVLKDMVGAIRPIVEKMGEWVKAHPELVSMIAKAAVGVGVLMTALGPFVFMVPKLLGMLKDLKIALAGMNIGFIAVVSGLLAVGAAADKLINKYKAQQDAEMQAIIKQSGPALEAIRMRTSLINAHVITVEQWGEIMQKHGRDYGKVMSAIATDPAYSKLKEEWDKIRKKQDEAKGSTKGLGDEYGELSGKLKAAEEWQKKFGEAMQTWGIKTLKEKQDRIGELLGFERDLGQLLKDGQLSSRDYGEAMKKLKEELFGYGEAINTALPPARDFRDLIGQAPGQVDDLVYAMQTEEDQLKDIARELGVTTNEALAYIYQMKQLQVLLTTGIWLPNIDFGVVGESARQATEDAKGYFAGLYNDIASGMGSTMEGFIGGIASGMDFAKGIFWEHGIDFKQFFEDIFGSIKTAFFRMVGEMVTDEVMGMFKNFFSSIGKAATDTMASTATTAVEAVGGITKGAGAAVSGLWTGLGAAVGSFLGTALAGLIKGGPSGHQQEQQINDTKDMRNFMADLVNATAWVNASLDLIKWERIERLLGGLSEVKGSVDFLRASLLGEAKSATGYLKSINDKIGSIGGAQHGAVMMRPGLVMTHGTPQEPEWIIPESRLLRMAAPSARGARPINVVNTVNLDGTIVTDRDYVRSRLMPELISALTSTEFRGKVQQALGVA